MKRTYVSPSIQVFTCEVFNEILAGSAVMTIGQDEATVETIVESRQQWGSIWDDDKDVKF